ncbi:Cuticle Protein CPAP1 [Hyalella azteca]|nr:Cuticle Protein CPAP1 [Hyalella azteca]
MDFTEFQSSKLMANNVPQQLSPIEKAKLLPQPKLSIDLRRIDSVRASSKNGQDNSRTKRKITRGRKNYSQSNSSPKETRSNRRPRLLRKVTKITPLGKRQVVPATLQLSGVGARSSHSERLNRTYKAQIMKQRYLEFRSLLPGAQEGHYISEEDLLTEEAPEDESSSAHLPGTERGNVHRFQGIVLKEQRSAGESRGSTTSGKLEKIPTPFLASNIRSTINQDTKLLTENIDTNSSSLENIARLLEKRLGPGARNTYDPSILVDFFALIALNKPHTKIRKVNDDIPGLLISSRRRGGDLTGRLSQRGTDLGLPILAGSTPPVAQAHQGSHAKEIEINPSVADSIQEQLHDRATSSLESPLIFSAGDLGTDSTTPRDGISVDLFPGGSKNRTSESKEGILSALDGTRRGSEFGPFSDGNDPSAGILPPALPPVLKASLYSYLVPRLMYLAPLTETIPGVPGLDYPIMSTVPYTNFYCTNMPWPGFYADTEARCQAWHMCDLDGRQASFLCPNGTIFNQAFMVCDWWYNSDCQAAPYLYPLNERLFQQPQLPPPTQQHRTLTAQVLDTLFL